MRMLKKDFYQELKRKDKIIDELKKQNLLLLKTALKQSKRCVELQEASRKKQ